MSLGTDILRLLADNGGLSVAEIARRLGQPELRVRQCLMGPLRPFASQDWSKQWHLNEQLDIQAEARPSVDRLRSLLGDGRPRLGRTETNVLSSAPSYDARLSAWRRDAHRWAVAEGHDPTLGALLSADAGVLPPDLSNRREELYRQIAGEKGVDQDDPFEPILTWFAALDERRRDILTKRTLVFGRGEILESLAERFGVTRERVRQLEKALLDDLDRWARSWEWRPVLWRAHSLAQAAGLSAPQHHAAIECLFAGLCGPTEDHDIVARSVLWRLAGPYIVDDDGWVVRSAASLEALRTRLAAGAGEDGFLALEVAATLAAEADLRPIFFEAWLTKEPRLRLMADRVIPWPSSIGERAEIVLRLRGEPQTVDALLEALGSATDARSLRSRLSGDERFARASLTEWALAAWGLPEYHSIAEAISGLLKDCETPMRIDDVVAQLCTQFGLSESSVRALCGAPRFIVQDGTVRMRRSDEPYSVSAELKRAPNVFKVGPHRACIVLSVDSQLLRGSGRSIPEPVGSLLDLEPGCDREFASEHGPVRVSWPNTSIAGPAIGSLRLFAEATGARAGDLLRIVLDGVAGVADLTLISPSALSDADAAGRLKLLTGLDVHEEQRDLQQTLARAVGTSTAELRRTLEQRGDEWLLPVLPVESVSTGLREAIDQLAELLDQ